MGMAGCPKALESHPTGYYIHERRRWQSFVALLRDAPWLTRGRLFGYSTALIAGTVGAMTWVLSGNGIADPMGRPVGTDFLRLWTASFALLNGDGLAIYEPDAFFALERAVTQPATPDFYPWNYPPSSLLIVYPLALLPYLLSLAAWLALGLVGYLAALWRIFPKPLTLWVGLAFPAVFWTVTHESGMNFGHYYKMQSVFAAARLLGSPMLVAYTLQALVALAAAAVVAWVWRRPTGDPDLKNATLMAATPLSTAFIFDYDLLLPKITVLIAI
jgi:hypothetical protein